MTVRITILIFLGFVLTACASADRAHWWKPGMTKDEFARDADLCYQMTAVRSPGAMVAGVRIRPSEEVDENAYTICMQAAGYDKVPKDFVPPK